jgi:hypothetical protein
MKLGFEGLKGIMVVIGPYTLWPISEPILGKNIPLTPAIIPSPYEQILFPILPLLSFHLFHPKNYFTM